MNRSLYKLFSVILIFSLLLAALPAQPTRAAANPRTSSQALAAAYTLQVLHYYGESGLLGVQTAPIMGALIEKFKTQYANTLLLGEGDSYIPGPWLVGGADPSLSAVAGVGSTALGRPDIAIMNAFGTDASALGNHEFDLGSPVLQGAIAASGAWVGAQFPLITANLDFSADSSLRGLADKTLNNNFNANNYAGAEASTIKGKIAPYAIVTRNGEKIGLVGATTYDLLSKTSPNGTVPKHDADPTTDELHEVAAYIQAAVDSLNTLGVNKIIMVDQLDTIDRNKLLAPLVSGVDVMVAGGGHERMGDATDTAVGFNGHTADFIADAYPIVTAGLDGKPTLIVTTDTEYTYLGRLVLDFDSNGEIIVANLDTAINGAYASTEANLQAAYGTSQTAAEIVAGSVTGAKVDAIVKAINAVIASKDGTLWGFTNVYLEGDRAYGRVQETNLGDISADANLYAAQIPLPNGFMTSLKNGGGIRASIGSIDEVTFAKVPPAANPPVGKPAGAISTLDVENALRFDNKLMVYDTTPQGLKNILEFAAGLSSGPTVQNGGYMQIGGMRVSYTPANPVGSKVQSIALIDLAGNTTAVIYGNGALYPGAPATIQMVCLNFTANGGDGYPIKANASNFRYLLADGTISTAVDPALDFTLAATFASVGQSAGTILGEQQAFKDYLVAFHNTPAKAYNQADTPIDQDQRIQILPLKASDTVIPPNNAPTDISLDKQSVAEGQSTGHVVGHLSSSDIDASDIYTYSLVTGTGDTDNASFTISGNQLRTNAVFDYVTKSSYSVRIRTTDNGSLFTEKAFVITITDATAPEAFISSQPVPSTSSTSANFTFYGTDAGTGVSSFECSLDAGSFTTCTSPLTLNGLSFGPHTLAVQAVDGAGNVTTHPAVASWVVVGTFADASISYWAAPFIERLFAAHVTSGCQNNPLSFCPDRLVTRAEAAVMLLRAKNGGAYTPPALPPAGTGFSDVPASYWAASWIKAAYDEGILLGFGDGTFHPDAPLTRAQTAVVLLRASNGAGYTPPAVPPAGTGFSDVADTYWAAAWIAEFKALNLTSGYGDGTYRPENSVTRAEFAVFLVRTFKLP